MEVPWRVSFQWHSQLAIEESRFYDSLTTCTFRAFSKGRNGIHTSWVVLTAVSVTAVIRLLRLTSWENKKQPTIGIAVALVWHCRYYSHGFWFFSGQLISWRGEKLNENKWSDQSSFKIFSFDHARALISRGGIDGQVHFRENLRPSLLPLRSFHATN